MRSRRNSNSGSPSAKPRTRRCGESRLRDCEGCDGSSLEGLACVLRWPFICRPVARPSREPPRPSQPFGFSPPRRTRTGPLARHELLHPSFALPHLPCIRYSRIERSCAVPFTYHAYRLSRTEQSCAVPRAASQQLQDHLLLRSESPTTLSKDHKTVLLLRSKIDRQVKG